MQIRSIQHRGLARFVAYDDHRGIEGSLVKRVRNIIAFLVTTENEKALVGPPGWRIHRLIGDRAGTWSISVSGNWRITFKLDDGEIVDLDLEDYH